MNTLFTRGPFGLRELLSPVSVCVCVSVCLSTFACPDDKSSHVPTRITWFGRKDARYFALGPYCFGGWLSLTFYVKFNFVSKFCLFAHTHSDSYICTPPGSCHGPWNSLVTNLCETIGVLPAFDSAIGSGYYKLLSVFVKLYAPHIPIFYITTSAITETLFVRVKHSPINPIFSVVVNTRVT